MGRPGARVARRKYKHGRIGFQHKVKKDDTVSWFKQRFDGIVGRVSATLSCPFKSVLNVSIAVNRLYILSFELNNREMECLLHSRLGNDVGSAGSGEECVYTMGCIRDVDAQLVDDARSVMVYAIFYMICLFGVSC